MSSRNVGRPRPSWAAAIVLLGVMLGSCAGGDAGPTTQATDSTAAATSPATRPSSGDTSTTTRPTVPPEDDPEAARIRQLSEDGVDVTFETSDGVRLRGLTFGTGPTAVVLSHMGRSGDNLEDWLVAADELAGIDRTILIYNRRGVCSRVLQLCSEGTDDLDESWRDVVAAAQFVREQDAERVVLGGASIGAMATFHAAERGEVEPDGLVWFGGVTSGEYTFDQESAARLPHVPILYMSAEDDTYDGGRAAQRMHDWTRDPRRLVLLPGFEHGTDLIAVDSEPDRRAKALAEIDQLIARAEQQ